MLTFFNAARQIAAVNSKSVDAGRFAISGINFWADLVIGELSATL